MSVRFHHCYSKLNAVFSVLSYAFTLKEADSSSENWVILSAQIKYCKSKAWKSMWIVA